jgi:hypothetical protein
LCDRLFRQLEQHDHNASLNEVLFAAERTGERQQ